VELFNSLRSHLPEPLRPVVSFAYIAGSRIPSEVLTLQWRQVNFNERLSPEQTTPGANADLVTARFSHCDGSQQGGCWTGRADHKGAPDGHCSRI